MVGYGGHCHAKIFLIWWSLSCKGTCLYGGSCHARVRAYMVVAVMQRYSLYCGLWWSLSCKGTCLYGGSCKVCAYMVVAVRYVLICW